MVEKRYQHTGPFTRLVDTGNQALPALVSLTPGGGRCHISRSRTTHSAASRRCYRSNAPLKKIFVGNLSPETSEQQLHDLFAGFGTVRSVKMPIDIFSRKSRGFAFIEMEGHEARAAVDNLNGQELGGQTLKVNFERPAGKRRR